MLLPSATCDWRARNKRIIPRDLWPFFFPSFCFIQIVNKKKMWMCSRANEAGFLHPRNCCQKFDERERESRWYIWTWALDMSIGHESISPISIRFPYFSRSFAVHFDCEAMPLCTANVFGIYTTSTQFESIEIPMKSHFHPASSAQQNHQSIKISPRNRKKRKKKTFFMEFRRIPYFDRNRINWLLVAFVRVRYKVQRMLRCTSIQMAFTLYSNEFYV